VDNKSSGVHLQEGRFLLWNHGETKLCYRAACLVSQRYFPAWPTDTRSIIPRRLTGRIFFTREHLNQPLPTLACACGKEVS
jgi:hypothetical protein